MSFNFQRSNFPKSGVFLLSSHYLLRNASHFAISVGGTCLLGQTSRCTVQWGMELWGWHLTHYQAMLLPHWGCDQIEMCALSCRCQDSCSRCHYVQTWVMQFTFFSLKNKACYVTSFQTCFLQRFVAIPYLMTHTFQKYQLHETEYYKIIEHVTL